MLLSSERPFVGAFAFCVPGATLLRCNGLTQAVLPESDWNMANGSLRFPRNLGESYSCSSAIPGWRYRVTNSRLWQCTRLAESENNEWQPRYRQAKETKCGEMAVGCRNALIVPSKLGNSPRRTQWRKAKRRPADSIEGNMLNTSRFFRHVNVSRSDSFGDHVVAKLLVEEPDALTRARPGLWERRVSNHAPPPGPRRVQRTRVAGNEG